MVKKKKKKEKKKEVGRRRKRRSCGEPRKGGGNKTVRREYRLQEEEEEGEEDMYLECHQHRATHRPNQERVRLRVCLPLATLPCRENSERRVHPPPPWILYFLLLLSSSSFFCFSPLFFFNFFLPMSVPFSEFFRPRRRQSRSSQQLWTSRPGTVVECAFDNTEKTKKKKKKKERQKRSNNIRETLIPARNKYLAIYLYTSCYANR